MTSSNMFSNSDGVGVYDHQQPELKWEMPQTAVARTKEREEQRSREKLEAWKEISSQARSQRIPKASLTKSCQYENKRGYSESIVTWSVFFVLASMAGVIGGLALMHLSL